MSIIDRIPRGSRPRFPIITFESDPLLAGIYNFQNAANTDLLLMPNVKKSSVYVIISNSVFGNVIEGDYLEGQPDSTNIPRFNLRLEKSNSQSIFHEPYRMGNYVDDLQQLIYFRSQVDDRLLASCFGFENQSAGMAGFLTIQLQVSFVIMEVTNQAWIKEYALEEGGQYRSPTIPGPGPI